MPINWPNPHKIMRLKNKSLEEIILRASTRGRRTRRSCWRNITGPLEGLTWKEHCEAEQMLREGRRNHERV